MPNELHIRQDEKDRGPNQSSSIANNSHATRTGPLALEESINTRRSGGALQRSYGSVYTPDVSG